MPKKKVKKESKIEKKKLSEKDFEKKVLELEKTGLTAEKIGEALRKDGIHPQEHTKISRILKKNNAYTSPDLTNVEKKLERVKKHLEKNKQDKRAMREKDRVFSHVRKLKKYLNIPLK